MEKGADEREVVIDLVEEWCERWWREAGGRVRQGRGRVVDYGASWGARWHLLWGFYFLPVERSVFKRFLVVGWSVFPLSFCR